VDGPHAPHRLQLADLALPDRDDPEALPPPFFVARGGLRLSASGRAAAMPFVVCNVEADEVHFVQQGALEYVTSHGTLVGEAGDFVGIPRAIEYTVRPLRTPTLSLIAEVPGAIRLEPTLGERGTIERPTVEGTIPSGGETVLLVKAFDGLTRYLKPHHPLASGTLVDGTVPVWKVRLADLASLPAPAGPPVPFATSPGGEELFYNLSARRKRRPPIHHNADYDEVIYYFAGPGAWGAVNEPGTVTRVPKGIVHHGPPEDVPEGYLAWLLDSRGTLRLTPVGLAAAELMEPGMYGRHADWRAPAGAEAALQGTSR
jgi:homogentisate 1,2-dioxygenase